MRLRSETVWVRSFLGDAEAVVIDTIRLQGEDLLRILRSR